MLKDLPCGDGAWLSEAECAAFDLGSFYGFVRVDVEVEKRHPWYGHLVVAGSAREAAAAAATEAVATAMVGGLGGGGLYRGLTRNLSRSLRYAGLWRRLGDGGCGCD